jgi:hypothetical protein
VSIRRFGQGDFKSVFATSHINRRQRGIMQVRPHKAVRRILKDGSTPYEIAAKTVALSSLLAHAFLDQRTRPRGKRAKPTQPGAKRVIQTKFARQARLSVLAHLHDRARKVTQRDLGRRILKRLLNVGGLMALANAPESDSLIERFRQRSTDVSYVVAVVDYLLRSNAYPDDGVPHTIEDAKGFVWLRREEYGITKIGQIWETYKLVAPYLYALNLEKSFRPSKIKGSDDVLDWVASFVRSSRRVARFLGHAAFAMDVLKKLARDQRESDFTGVVRIQPLLQRFTADEKVTSGSVDRGGEGYGRSCR